MGEALERLAELVKALEQGRYDAKPSKLRQGCIYALMKNPDGTFRAPTEEELDAIYAEHARQSSVGE
jgi:HAMP domain-containing protein